MNWSRWRLVVPDVLRWSGDLLAVVALAWLPVVALFVPQVAETAVHVAAGVAAVVFAPGYALVAALHPDRGRGVSVENSPGYTNVDTLGRLALAVGLSIALVPLLGILLSFTPWRINPLPFVGGIAAFTTAGAVVAVARRASVRSEERFGMRVRRTAGRVRTWLFVTPDTRTDAALNVMLAVGLVLAVGGVGFAAVTAESGESMTEFSLLTRGGDGTLVADDYPTTFTAGEPKPVVVGIGNHEGESRRYTVVVELQRVADDDGTTVVETQTLQRFRTRVAADRTVRSRVSLAPRMTGENLRLAFLLYRGTPPENPTIENAYRETHLWVEVDQS